MNLAIKPSQISNAGMGLFTDDAIREGEHIVEYTGEITTWAKVKDDWKNVYIYYISEEIVINAKNFPETAARYANDADGLTSVKNLRNNSEFANVEGRIYIRAIRNIAPGEEILVSYGADYWETIRTNQV